jgi:hypothetical protein
MRLHSIAAFIAAAAILLSSILMYSCQKHLDQTPVSKEKQVAIPAPSTLKAKPMTGGGKDDDGPIVQHIVQDPSQTPVQNASVVMINGTDTLQQLTDANGKCTVQTTGPGWWEIKITHPDYSQTDTLVNFSDSLCVKTSVLYHQ